MMYKKWMKKLGIACLLVSLSAVAACTAGGGASSSSSSSSSGSSSGSSSSSSGIVFYCGINVRSCTAGGTVTPSKNQVLKGESCTVTIAPETGYVLTSFKVNGEEKKSEVVEGVYTIESVQNGVFLDVEFSPSFTYVSKTNAPVLDGEIDEVWDTATTLYVNKIYEDNGTWSESDHAWAKVLWTEEGFYYLGYVYDSTVVASDRFNFWVSETYVYADSKDDTRIPYSSNIKDGNYSICINPQGEHLYYSGANIAQYWDDKSTAKITEDGYVVEIFVPCQSVASLSEGMEIGFDMSVDYYATATGERNACVNWNGAGWYWSNIGALRKVVLTK